MGDLGKFRRTGAAAFALLVAVALAVPAAAAAAGSISGTVTGPAAEPLEGIRVCAVDGDIEEIRFELCTHTDAAGHYLVGPLPASEYAVEFISGPEGLNFVYEVWNDRKWKYIPDLVPVADAEVPGIDAQLAEGGLIGGKVRSATDGSPLPGVEVCAEPHSLEAEEECTMTGLAGEYTLIGLSQGSYDVEFRPPEEIESLPQYYDEEPGILYADPVHVSSGSLTPNVDAALRETGQIGGTIVDAASRAPLAGAGACAWQVGGREWHCAVADAAGRYRIRRLAPGNYVVSFDEPEGRQGERYARQWYRCANGEEEAQQVGVDIRTETPGIDGALTHPFTGDRSQCLAALAPPALPPPAQPQTQARHRKHRRCGKGRRRRRVHGKVRCVKVHQRHRHRR